MKSIEMVGRTVDEAIAEALAKLEAVREDVEITVLDEGSKGFFGIIGSKQAKVLVEKKQLNHEQKLAAAIDFLEKLFKKMDFPVMIDGSSDEESVELQVSGDDLGILIGRRGLTLDSLQYITTLAVNRQGGDWIRINLDIGDYRAKRQDSLRTLANKAATKAESTGRRVALEPMNAAERRIVHQELQNSAGIQTQSEGQDPNRRVVIVPK